MTTSDLPVGFPDVETLTRMANAALQEFENGFGGHAPAQAPNSIPGVSAGFPAGPSGFAGNPVPPDPRPHAQYGGPTGSHPAAPLPSGPAPQGVIPKVASPESLGLPGDETLRLLLGGTSAPGAQIPSEVHGTSESPFYFLNTPTGSAGPDVFKTADRPSVPGSIAAPFDVNAVRGDFPILNQSVNGKPLIWLDNAATT